MKWSTKVLIQCQCRQGTYQVFGEDKHLVFERQGTLDELEVFITSNLQEKDIETFLSVYNAWKKGEDQVSQLKFSYRDARKNYCWYGLQFVKCDSGFFMVWEEISRYLGLRKALKNKDAKLLEQDRLLKQLNLHVLFNTMNVIKGYIEFVPKEAGKLVNLLAKSLRTGLEMLRNDGPVLFTKELEYINRKLEIEQVTYENLRVDIECPIQEFYVPPFVVQRLVEGLLVKGVLDMEKEQRFVVKTRVKDKNVEIELLFQGVNPQERPLEDRMAIERIESLMGGNVELKTEENEVGALISFPQSIALEGAYLI